MSSSRFIRVRFFATSLLFAAAIGLFVAAPKAARADSCTDPTATYSCVCTTGSATSPSSSTETTAQACNDMCYNAYKEGGYKLTCTEVREFGDKSTTHVAEIAQGDVSAPQGTLTEAPAETEAAFVVPDLNVDIPGFAGFSEPTKSADGTIVNVNFLGEYINAIYSWALGAGALVAVVMMMIGGLQYVLSRGKPKYIEKAKTRITNAITGMVLLLAAYNIAFLIDPSLVNLDPLGVTNVQGIEYFPADGEDDNVIAGVTISGSSTSISGNYITGGCPEGCTANEDVITALKTAATTFHNTTGKNVVIASATRSLSKQANLFYANCLLKGGTCSPTTCNPSSGVVTKSGGKWTLTGEFAGLTNGTTIVADLVSHANLANCPHTSSVAIDAWCDDGGTNYRHDPLCQGQLISAMISAGFCRLSSEAWHFELNSKKVSSACSTSNNSISYSTKSGKTYNPPSDCAKWDFKNNICAVKKQ